MTVKQIFLVPLVAILLLTISPAYAAKQGTVQAIIPWDAEGRVFQVGTNTVMFLGSLRCHVYRERGR